MSERILKVGIIGQGRSGRNIHANTLSGMKDKFVIAAVVDALEDRRKRAVEDFGCDAYEEYQELFQRTDLDFVVNASPSHLHVPISLDLLNHGFNVLCEKPLAGKVEEVDQLIAAAKKAGKTLGVFQNSRYLPSYLEMRKIIDSGVLGRLVQVSIHFNNFGRRWDWQTLQENNGGNLLNTGPHPMDQALQLFGDDVTPRVTCMMDRANTYGDAEDYVKLLLHGDNRPVIDIEISSCCAYQTGFTYNIQGTCGGLRASANKMEWKYFVPEEAPEQVLTRTPIINADGQPAYCRETLPWQEHSMDLKAKEGVKKEEAFYRMFYQAIANGAPLEVTPQQVRVQIGVVEECQRQNPHIYKR
ncbi:MAG: oxidoreductase [Paenibacillaceae bacterium]|jgi:predicted dehydrogenase|nr:oxidoreductase [Paenibacillaceae bacterium]